MICLILVQARRNSWPLSGGIMNVFGEKKDSSFPKSTQNGVGYFLMMVVVSALDLNIKIMSGVTIL